MAPPPSHSQSVLPQPDTLLLEGIEKHGNSFRIFVSPKTRSPPCPICGQRSQSRHSRYGRRLADLPWQGCSLELWLNLHKYRCLEPKCPRKIFCERIPGVAQAYARRSDRLAIVIASVGYAAGGLPAARLLAHLAIFVSDDSVRRQVLRTASGRSPQSPLRQLGIDDWAWRKHHRYGTIVVDLERRKVVDLLPDRRAESVASWLSLHPSVEVVARDRSSIYADGAAQGAPLAQQVADRFHLISNLSTAVEKVLESRTRELTLPPLVDAPSAAPIPGPGEIKMTATQLLQQQRRERRLERYQELTALRHQGFSKKAISRKLSIGIKTVRRWLRADQFPERKTPRPRPTQVFAFAEYLEARWQEGVHNAAQLYKEIRARGYCGSEQRVRVFVAPWRLPDGRRPKAAKPQRVAPKHAAILAGMPSDKLTPDQQDLLGRLLQNCPDLGELRSVALAFRAAFSTKDSTALFRWIEEAKGSRFAPLLGFACGLEKDILAVRAAVEMEFSNGQTEGQINRLKTLKRQMYGRAGFAYLRARVLPAPHLNSPLRPSPP